MAPVDVWVDDNGSGHLFTVSQRVGSVCPLFALR